MKNFLFGIVIGAAIVGFMFTEYALEIKKHVAITKPKVFIMPKSNTFITYKDEVSGDITLWIPEIKEMQYGEYLCKELIER